ncbi:unnamed protein product [Mytilus coruscus]|uniref:C2H2-type domain-containing protein n=1 Tax=Mytilus coruscus TaxID=42192 RepID=A0A6J8BQS4_MYTCO|nr:unnamed protein product [Mytilus coruscus]
MVINKYIIFVGKRISWDNIGTTEQRTNLLVKVDWTIAAPQLLEEEVMTQEEELIEPNPKKQKKNSIHQPYDCPKDGCTRAFKTQCALEQHIIVGNCDYHEKQLKIKQNQCMGKRKDYLTGQQITAYFQGWHSKTERPTLKISDLPKRKLTKDALNRRFWTTDKEDCEVEQQELFETKAVNDKAPPQNWSIDVHTFCILHLQADWVVKRHFLRK